jgi:hypothetical protein
MRVYIRGWQLRSDFSRVEILVVHALKEKTMRHLFAGWMGCIGLVAMLAGGAPAAGAAPAPGQGVSLLTDTDEYARAVLTDGQLTLSLEATVGEDGTRSISVKRADGTLFYAVVMDAQHTALYRQYGPVAVRSEDSQQGLSPEMTEAREETLREETLASPEATLLAGFHHQVDMNTPHQALAELVAFASTVEALLQDSGSLSLAPESAEGLCVNWCCGSSCDCHGHRRPTCVNGGCCGGGANASCPWWPPSATCRICAEHDRCVHNRGEHNGPNYCVF